MYAGPKSDYPKIFLIIHNAMQEECNSSTICSSHIDAAPALAALADHERLYVFSVCNSMLCQKCPIAILKQTVPTVIPEQKILKPNP